MKLYLNVFYPNPDHLDLAKRLGFDGVRTQIDTGNREETLAGANLLRERGLYGLWLSRDWNALNAYGETGVDAVELGNEEDSKRTPAEYHAWVMGGLADFHRAFPGVTIYTAGITTPDRKRLDWLREVYRRGIPDYVNTAIHTYRTDREPREPHTGFASRDQEFTEVRRIVGDRALICSEIGWHTAPSKRKKRGWLGLLGLKETVQYDEGQVSAFMAQEAQICKRNACQIMVFYQVTDGPRAGDYFEDSFGLMRADGSLKPLANEIQNIRTRLA